MNGKTSGFSFIIHHSSFLFICFRAIMHSLLQAVWPSLFVLLSWRGNRDVSAKATTITVRLHFNGKDRTCGASLSGAVLRGFLIYRRLKWRRVYWSHPSSHSASFSVVRLWHLHKGGHLSLAATAKRLRIPQRFKRQPNLLSARKRKSRTQRLSYFPLSTQSVRS